MTMREFIQNNRAELSASITRFLGHVPATASCDCPHNRTDHYHETDPIDDEDIRQWVLNDEGLYNWARSEGVREDDDEEEDA